MCLHVHTYRSKNHIKYLGHAQLALHGVCVVPRYIKAEIILSLKAWVGHMFFELDICTSNMYSGSRAIIIPGCDCPKGKVLDQTTGKCVKECQNRCPIEGQVYKLCMDRPGDPATCANGFPLPIKECIHGCECPLGQVLNLTGERCVPPEQCL